MRSTGGLDIEPVSLLPGEGEVMQQSVKASTSRPTSSKSKTSPNGGVSSMKVSSTTVGGAPSKPSSRQSPVVRQDVVEPRPPSAASRKQVIMSTMLLTIITLFILKLRLGNNCVFIYIYYIMILY